eukprot:6011322-Amphidinium_carterae.1
MSQYYCKKRKSNASWKCVVVGFTWKQGVEYLQTGSRVSLSLSPPGHFRAKVEILTSVLGGCVHIGPGVPKWTKTRGVEIDYGHCFICIDPRRFTPGFEDHLIGPNEKGRKTQLQLQLCSP